MHHPLPLTKYSYCIIAGSLANIHGDYRSCVGEGIANLELPLGLARLHGRLNLVLCLVSLLIDLLNVLSIKFYAGRQLF